jgi:hypothetical protein
MQMHTHKRVHTHMHACSLAGADLGRMRETWKGQVKKKIVTHTCAHKCHMHGHACMHIHGHTRTGVHTCTCTLGLHRHRRNLEGNARHFLTAPFEEREAGWERRNDRS